MQGKKKNYYQMDNNKKYKYLRFVEKYIKAI